MQAQAARVNSTRVWPSGPPANARAEGTRIRLGWDRGDERSLNVTWLRDNCVCHDCRIAQTGEHRFFLGDQPSLPEVHRASVEDAALVVHWVDGHTSRFTPADFEAIVSIAERDHPPVEPWAHDFEPDRFDHDDVIADLDHRIAFLEATMRDGMALITDMPDRSGACIEFLERIGVPIRDTPFDRLHDVYFHADGYNVAHTDEPLPPHNDFASYTWPPSGQLIHMLVNEVAGGEWVNVDGFRVLADLGRRDPTAIDVLARVPVAFREHSTTAESWTRAPLVRRDATGGVTGLRFSNQLMQPIDPCDPDLEAFYEAYHALARAIADPANQIEFRGDGGTMQVLHGHRILHARRGFDGTSGRRHLQDTYFEFDDLCALHAVATGMAR